VSETPKRGGRPRVDERGERLSTYLRVSDHDAIVRLALKSDRSVSAVVRTILRRHLAHQR
jgi:hypothetical protein